MASNTPTLMLLLRRLGVGKGNLDWGEVTALWACDEDGDRKWIVKQYVPMNQASAIAPFIWYVQGSKPGNCIFYGRPDPSNFSPSAPLDCYDFDLRTGKSIRLEGITLALTMMPMTRVDPTSPRFFSLFDINYSGVRLFRWGGVETGFQPVLSEAVKELEGDGFKLLDVLGSTYSDEVFLVATKKNTMRSSAKSKGSTTHLFWLDATSDSITSSWVIPSYSNNSKATPMPAREYKASGQLPYRTTASRFQVVHPPGSDGALMLLHHFNVFESGNPEARLNKGDVLYTFNPERGLIAFIKLPSYSDVFGLNTNTNPAFERIQFACYDPKNDITYLTFYGGKKLWKTLGLRSDHTWTDPLPVVFEPGFSHMARDGAFWVTEEVAPPTAFANGKEAIIRYDPVSGEKKTVATAENVFIYFTLD